MDINAPAATNIAIRLATPEDRDALAALKLATFRETFLDGFAIPYPPADLAHFEESVYGPARIAAEIADPAHRTWVASDGSRLVAYVHIGPCKLPHDEVAEGDMELYQLYLLGEAQGTGLGGRLLDLATAHIEGLGGPVWLGVWSGNLKAQAVYRRRGFEKVGEYKFPVGDWMDDEFIFRRTTGTR